MLDIKYNGTHVNFVTADDVLDVKEFQKKNLQEDIIEKMLLTRLPNIIMQLKIAFITEFNFHSRK